ELASMMPRAGGQYVYLREAFSPLWGFLYGWTLFLVIQTGTIAAVAVAFARFLGLLVPGIAEDRYLIAPVHLSAGYALSLSTAQVVAVALIALLTWTNTRGIDYGRIIQNVFTVAKTGELMAAAILVSTFGCNNGLILAGARAYYAMARDGLFFTVISRLNAAKVPAAGLVVQGMWSALLVLPRTYNVETGKYGNLYSNLLDYVISAALLFYVLSIVGVFRLRATRPNADRPYRAFGYPIIPALYVLGASAILLV